MLRSHCVYRIGTDTIKLSSDIIYACYIQSYTMAIFSFSTFWFIAFTGENTTRNKCITWQLYRNCRSSIDTYNHSTAWLWMYVCLLYQFDIDWLHIGFRTRTGGWELWLLPWRWHILSIPLKAGRGISAIYYIHTTHYSRILTFKIYSF